MSRSSGSTTQQRDHTTGQAREPRESAPGVEQRRRETPERIAWDALRAAAMLLGVVLHALIPYMAVPVPHLLWPVREPQALSMGIDATYWWIHGFRVQMFFIIAGIFAATTLRSRTVREFLVRRLQRLGVPLLLGTALLLPVMYLVWAWGWVRMGVATPSNIMHIRFGHGMQQDLYGFAHLWFLYFLVLFSIVAACVVALAGRFSGVMQQVLGPMERARAMRGVVGGLLGLGGAAPIVIILYYPRVITEFHHWFIPHPADLAYSASYYVVGMAMGTLSRRSRPRNVLDFAGPLLGASVLFVVFYTRFMQGDLLDDYGFALSLTLYTLLSYVGFSSLFVWLAQRESRGVMVLARLAPVALWLYIIHPPVVGAAQVLLYQVGVPAWAKVVVAAAVAMVAGIVTYPLATRVGRAILPRSLTGPT